MATRFRSPLACLLFIASLFSTPSFAKVLGDPNALKGGTFTIGFAAYPKDLLVYLGNDELSEAINSQILESLLNQDPETYDFIPGLASKWTVSPDKKTFTFTLDKEAHFSDGHPVTAKDVKFTWDTILNPKNKTAVFQAIYASFESCKVIDDTTIEFKAKTLHFKNLEKLAGLIILPEHFFSKGDFNKSFHTKILGSGPYTLESIETGEKIALKRDPNYWAAKKDINIGMNNFDRLVYRAVPDYNVQFELFKKGELDYFYFLSAKTWATQTDGSQFKNNYIKKLKVENLIAFATQGIVWNLRRPLFQDKRVRTALSYLYNRQKWIKDLFYDNYVMEAGPVAVSSPYHSPKNKPIPYDPEKARKLLKEAGWTKVGSDGVLVKDGLRFEFDLITDNSGSERYLTLYQEDLKKLGIKLNIRTLDWTTALKITEDWKFDAREQAQGRDVEPADFGVSWGSKAADIKGGANIGGYKNPELDKLATQIDETFDKKKRIPMVQKLDLIIGEDQPMTFAWEPSFTRIAYWNKFSFPGKGYYNYSTWKGLFSSWWFDPKKEAALKAAMAKGAVLSN